MRPLKIVFGGLFVLAVFVAVGAWFGLPYLNMYRTDGESSLAGLNSEVTVTRDENGMAYIRAQNLADAIEAQGFVTAHDRLFQIQLTRLLAQGRISELAGESAKPLDIMYRTIGIHRHAKRHAEILEPETRAFFQRYVDGINAFIKNHPGDVHLEFKFAGINPETWTIADSLSVLYYMSWSSSANMQTEIIAQMLVEKLGAEKAREIFRLNVNPDDPNEGTKASLVPVRTFARLGLERDETLISLAQQTSHRLGSNNWAVSPRFSPGDKPRRGPPSGCPHLAGGLTVRASRFTVVTRLSRFWSFEPA